MKESENGTVYSTRADGKSQPWKLHTVPFLIGKNEGE